MKCKYCNEFDKDCFKCQVLTRYQKVKNNQPQPFYVIVYGITQHYGGPEEGGWYFDFQRVLDVRKVWTVRQALLTIKQLKEWYPAPRYNRFSVLGGEDIRICLLPVLDLIYETDEIPRYE